jgi:hypothetical protein
MLYIYINVLILKKIVLKINGYIYGNLPDFPVHEGDRVVFYTMGLNLGYHDMGFQGQSLVVKHKR